MNTCWYLSFSKICLEFWLLCLSIYWRSAIHMTRHGAIVRETWRHAQNRKYVKYCETTRKGQSHEYRQHAQKLMKFDHVVFTARRYASAVYAVVLFLCESVRRQYCTKTAKHRITQITLHDSRASLVLCSQRSRRNLNGVTHKGGATALFNQCQGVG